MKVHKKIFKAFGTLLIAALLFAAMPAGEVKANDISSSTIVFKSVGTYTLTPNGDGTYTGVIPVEVSGGFDIYAKEGGGAFFSDSSTGAAGTTVTIGSDHDAWTEDTPDTPDWYQYSLRFYEESGVQKWALRNHPGDNATASSPWYQDTVADPRGVPMSGTMHWGTMYAEETDTGAYLEGTGSGKYPGTAQTNGGGAGYWDMDWSWGSEAVPLEYPGFEVNIEGSETEGFTVTFTPAEGPVKNTTSGMTYATIQAAIDAASDGDTINVAAGTYTEQVNIGKSLNLIGAGAATTVIQAPTSGRSTVTESGILWDYVVAAYPSSGTINVKIQGFTLDANSQDGSASQNFAGVFFRDVGDGTDDGLYSCTINNFGSYGAVWSSTYNTWMGNYGVQVYGTSKLAIDDNDINDYTVSGISALGSNVNVVVSGNNVNGTDSDYAGVYLRDGVGTITGNNIHAHTNAANGIGIYLYQAAEGTNFNDSVAANTIANNYIGVFLAGTDNATIDGNTFTGNTHRSIVVQQDSDNNVISDNTITMPEETTTVSSAIYIGSDSGGNIIGGDTEVDGNVITMPQAGAELYVIHLSGTDTGDVTIKYNTITGGLRAVQFDGGPGHSGTNTVSNNTMIGSTFGGVMSSCFGDFVITNNTITDTERPLEFWQGGNGNITISGNTLTSTAQDVINAGSFGTMTVHNNNLSSTGSKGINNQTTTSIDAENNWWNSASGPVHVGNTYNVGSQSIPVSDYVDYTPWLDAAYPDGTSFAPVTNGTNGYASIQAAVDAASDDDTINVYPGTYVESLKDGVSGSTTYQVALLLNKPNITIQSVGTAEETIIDVPFTGGLTTGVFVEANMGTVTFDGFTVQNFGETGIVQGSANAAGTTFHVKNNIVTPVNGYLRNGIQVTGANSTVIGNFVNGAPLTDEWASTAIFALADGVLVEGNTVVATRPVGDPQVDIGVGVYGSNVTVRNNFVQDAKNGIRISSYSGTIDGVNIEGNVIIAEEYNYDAQKMGINIQVADVSNLTVNNNKIQNVAYGFRVSPTSADLVGPITLRHNQFENNYWHLLYYNDPATLTIDAEENWWDSIAGPADTGFGSLYLGSTGLVDYIPWCGDAECSFLVSPLEGEITTLITIDEYDTHYLLKDGTTINTGDGACFDITASNVTIMTESPGGAVCYPGSPGITVYDGATNVVIEGLEIDGQGTAVGNGIDFLGAVTDVIISDNYIHDMVGNGVNFAAAPGGYVEITGNLFKDNSLFGIEAPADLDVRYNAWGDYGGPTTGDGVSTNINATSYTPWTHVDVEVVYQADSTRYANEVAYGETPAEDITYEIYANLQEAYGGQFTLTFDPAKLQVAGTPDTTGTVFPDVWDTTGVTPGVTVDNVAGKITFAGGAMSAVSGENQFLFSVTFTGEATTDVANPLSFDEADEDLFGMSPDYGASLNIYADELVGVEDVNVYELPTLAIDPLATYAVGNPKEFTLTVTNPATGRAYTDLNVDLDVPAGATLEYWDGGAWVTYATGVDIGALAVDAAADVLFRITFDTAGDIDITVTLNDGTIFLVDDTFTFTVLEAYTVTGTVQMQGRTTRSGVLVALAHETIPEYGYDTLSTNVITHNYTLDNLAEGSYGISITHDRYLDFNYTGFSLTADALDLARLELKGGDVAKNNEIDISDASLVGTNYGAAGDDDADANFDGKVNIQDLAMIGGNFDLTSDTAYTGWTP